MPAPCYHADTPLIPAHYQPALVLEHARGLDLNSHVLLRHSGLFEEDFASEARALSPAQLLAMLANLAQHDAARDAAFQLGQQMLPGHYGAASLALMQSPDLGSALRLLVAHQAQLCPLLAPRLSIAGGEVSLDWFDSCGAGATKALLVDLHMTAVTAMCRWLGGEHLPWRYHFNRTRPRSPEHHQVHLGSALHFGEQTDSMRLDARWLDQPWPRGNARALALTQRELADTAGRRSLLQAVREQLFDTIRLPPTLEHTAQHFGVSPATLKRQLARHGTHFQALLDEVRTHVTLQLMQHGGLDHDAIASHLRFHDARSFRRAFQRWTGLGAASPCA
ncbi:AraC family transcriptional regulator ligand-binding domain-containing protein [Niveibacterium sp. 24ML]|uniref:AraC family transcriptional regulator ligand-binding domain-containing protein n=1 Tax=Niveibacterium sp. 24ML TaxID=2985512 RepID=UPI0022715CB1|nr:AraC family transcriptional regulator ligand-binding domain-containing protein [Niveibacterium sp. 24ML]MCX9156390.1 AraC family transcriptional regulator ligand-binding domain-containing protein [Niveibacterium sp. 24ML]